jgi:hypothetical protein
MSLPAWREEPIAKKHDRASFDCGEPALNDFLQRHGTKVFARSDGSRCSGAPDRRQIRASGEMVLVLRCDAAGGRAVVPIAASCDYPKGARNPWETLRHLPHLALSNSGFNAAATVLSPSRVTW